MSTEESRIEPTRIEFILYEVQINKKEISEAKKLILEELMKELPAKAKAKWGSENQDAYVQYEHGFNSCLKEVEETLRKLFE